MLIYQRVWQVLCMYRETPKDQKHVRGTMKNPKKVVGNVSIPIPFVLYLGIAW